MINFRRVRPSRLAALAVGVTVLATTAMVVPAHAQLGTVTPDTINYRYTGIRNADPSTCAGSWAQDTVTRTFKVYKEQGYNGHYFVLAQYSGTFATSIGPSPQSCASNTNHTLITGLQGTFHGYQTFNVSNTNKLGNWSAANNLTCSITCSTAEWMANAFGPSAVFTLSTDWWFSYRTSDAGACAKHWINASYGNFGDIATSCLP
jgi:hypothetical protein